MHDYHASVIAEQIASPSVDSRVYNADTDFREQHRRRTATNELKCAIVRVGDSFWG